MGMLETWLDEGCHYTDQYMPIIRVLDLAALKFNLWFKTDRNSFPLHEQEQLKTKQSSGSFVALFVKILQNLMIF